METKGEKQRVREERRLMRQRGAGARELKDAKFTFGFSLPSFSLFGTSASKVDVSQAQTDGSADTIEERKEDDGKSQVKKRGRPARKAANASRVEEKAEAAPEPHRRRKRRRDRDEAEVDVQMEENQSKPVAIIVEQGRVQEQKQEQEQDLVKSEPGHISQQRKRKTTKSVPPKETQVAAPKRRGRPPKILEADDPASLQLLREAEEAVCTEEVPNLGPNLSSDKQQSQPTPSPPPPPQLRQTSSKQAKATRNSKKRKASPDRENEGRILKGERPAKSLDPNPLLEGEGATQLVNARPRRSRRDRKHEQQLPEALHSASGENPEAAVSSPVLAEASITLNEPPAKRRGRKPATASGKARVKQRPNHDQQDNDHDHARVTSPRAHTSGPEHAITRRASSTSHHHLPHYFASHSSRTKAPSPSPAPAASTSYAAPAPISATGETILASGKTATSPASARNTKLGKKRGRPKLGSKHNLSLPLGGDEQHTQTQSHTLALTSQAKPSKGSFPLSTLSPPPVSQPPVPALASPSASPSTSAQAQAPAISPVQIGTTTLDLREPRREELSPKDPMSPNPAPRETEPSLSFPTLQNGYQHQHQHQQRRLLHTKAAAANVKSLHNKTLLFPSRSTKSVLNNDNWTKEDWFEPSVPQKLWIPKTNSFAPSTTNAREDEGNSGNSSVSGSTRDGGGPHQFKKEN